MVEKRGNTDKVQYSDEFRSMLIMDCAVVASPQRLNNNHRQALRPRDEDAATRPDLNGFFFRWIRNRITPCAIPVLCRPKAHHAHNEHVR